MKVRVAVETSLTFTFTAEVEAETKEQAEALVRRALLSGNQDGDTEAEGETIDDIQHQIDEQVCDEAGEISIDDFGWDSALYTSEGQA